MRSPGRASKILPAAGLFVLLLLTGGGAGAASDLALSSLMQQGKNHELIRELQPLVDGGKSISSFELMMLGSAYYEVRQYRNALATADVMQKHIAAGDSSNFGGDLTVYPQLFRAGVALDQGAYEQAVQLATAAHKSLKQGQFFYRIQLIQVDNILGVANAFLGHADAARKSLEEIRQVSLFMSNLGPEKYIAMARIHMALREFDKALADIEDPDSNVVGILTMFYDPTFQNLPKFFIRCKSLFETRKTKEAKEGYDQLLKHPQIGEFGGIYWLVLYDRARIALDEGDAATAIDLLRKAVEVIEQQRSSIDSESGRIGFVGDKQAVYQLLVSQLLAAGRDETAFEYVERSKARALVDLLASQKNFKLPAQDAAETGSTLRKLSEAESQLVAVSAPDDQSGGARTRKAVIELRSRLRTESPELASLVTVASVPPAGIQALLQPDESLVEYYYSAQELFAFVMTGEGIKAVKLEREGLEAVVARFRRCLSEPASANCVDEAQKLYDRLFRPVAGLLRGNRLVIVPHGVLHYLPFNALHSGQSFLIDDYAIRVEPSAGVLDLIKGRGQKTQPGALLLGNPDLGKPEFDLKYAEEETVAISKLMPDATVLLRDGVTRSYVKNEGGHFGILHFATHGQFDLADPLNSALLLTPEPGGDGRLTVGDLYTLKLDANLVTLSACETGLGKVASGDDVVGFTRGLLYAGTSTIVSSLWSVDDLATRDMMVAFYSNLPRLGKLEALRQAQLTVKQQRPHPFFWAAFELTGNAK